jgi:adenylosuccinate lyase
MTQSLAEYVSEFALMKYRIRVEVAWFQHLVQEGLVTDSSNNRVTLTDSENESLRNMWANFDDTASDWVKEKERETNHDIKAIEYFVKQFSPRQDLNEYFHVCCTSEDINNLSYALMFKDATEQLIFPTLANLRSTLIEFTKSGASVPMMSRTHGQPAPPTTLGKEMGNFTHRLHNHMKTLENLRFTGKCNGAVGNYNAHLVTFRGQNWLDISRRFVEGLGLEWNPYTTQIEPHDSVGRYLGQLTSVNTVLLVVARDMWDYISLGYFRGAVLDKEVGSSTMPHKVNPIQFENAEGNLGIANSLLLHLQHKLPISRFQRDLTDSTAMRNVGSALSYSLLAYQSLLQGFKRITVNAETISQDLDKHWEILAEPVIVMLNHFDIPQPRELLRKLTKNKSGMSRQDYFTLVSHIAENETLPPGLEAKLRALTPHNYVGLAPDLAANIESYLN